jgi:molybdopterin-guanine dinucleotide biosynthesis protein A
LAATLPRSSNEWNLVLGCDMPYANSALFEFLIGEKGTSLGVIPIHDKLIEPVAALYRQTAGRIFEDELAKGHYSLYKILLDNDFTFPDAGFLLTECPFLFKSMNEPDDLVAGWPEHEWK